MILSAMSVSIPETAPQSLKNIFGSLTNLGINLGLAIYMFLNEIIPKDTTKLEATNIWRYLLAIPAVFSVVILLLFITVFREDSLIFLVLNNKLDEASALIKNIYKPVTPEAHQQILQEIIQEC